MAKRGVKTRCNGRWTEAKYNAFIKNLLRHGHLQKWACGRDRKLQVRDGKIANPATGYLNIASKCEICGGRFMESTMKIDHIDPVVDPATGFTTWDDCIARMFCEPDGYQILCKGCHDKKTLSETKIRYKK